MSRKRTAVAPPGTPAPKLAGKQASVPAARPAPGPPKKRYKHKRKGKLKGAWKLDIVPQAAPVSDRSQPAPSQPTPAVVEAGPSKPAAPAPRAKRQRKAAKPQPEERIDCYGRAVRYSACASQKVQDRLERAAPGSCHRIYLIERTVVEREGGQESTQAIGGEVEAGAGPSTSSQSPSEQVPPAGGCLAEQFVILGGTANGARGVVAPAWCPEGCRC